MRKWIFIILVLLVIPAATASFFNPEDLTFSLAQEEYYFKVGENAILPLTVENTYPDAINGLLTYTLAQSANQGNVQYSNSNTQSLTFSIDAGEKDIPMSFETSNTPVTLSVDLKFSYIYKDKPREVVLDSLKIHFVSDESQKNNQQNERSSSSQKAPAQQENTPQPQSQQQVLQNNQMPQDSSALKQQMQKQIQEQQQMKEAFQKQVSQTPEFQKEHQDLMDKGYELTNANTNPSSENTGDFELDYENPAGEQASLKGKMQDGEMQELFKDTPEERQKMLEHLQQNKRFQKYEQRLQDQGFEQQDVELSQEQNKTSVQVNYLNQNNETASIKADIVNNTAKNVELINPAKDERNKAIYLGIALLFIAAASILGYVAYNKFIKKPKRKQQVIEKAVVETPFDYRSKALSLLEKAKKLFERSEHKNAYGKAGQALRLYLSYGNNLKKEITNDEIIAHLRKHKKQFRNAKECFDLCSLVAFAKYRANKKDFDKIISYAKKVIVNK